MRLQPAGRATKSWTAVPSLSIVLIVVVVLAGCGSSSKSSTSAEAPASSTTSSAATSVASQPASEPSGAAETIKLEANPEGQLSYNTKSLTAKAGKVTIEFTNMAPVGHNVNVESSSGQAEGETPTFQGSTKSVTLNLKAGKYTFFCSVPGHRQGGMEGTLTVQ